MTLNMSTHNINAHLKIQNTFICSIDIVMLMINSVTEKMHITHEKKPKSQRYTLK